FGTRGHRHASMPAAVTSTAAMPCRSASLRTRVPLSSGQPDGCRGRLLVDEGLAEVSRGWVLRHAARLSQLGVHGGLRDTHDEPCAAATDHLALDFSNTISDTGDGEHPGARRWQTGWSGLSNAESPLAGVL